MIKARNARRARWRLSLGAAALLAMQAASAFQLDVAEPGFSVDVPGLPALRVESGRGTGGRLAGGDGVYQVELLVSRADKAISTRECAGSFLRALVARPGMPDRDSIYRAPLDAKTFLVLYILGADTKAALHAHLVSASHASHCIDAHFSRPMRPGEDEDDWRRSFAGSRIEDR